MPNVACNTSSFLKSNCKYLRTVESREWKPAKPQEPIWDGAEIAVDGSFWENYVEAHTCLFNYRCVLEYVLELWTVKMSWYFIESLTDELMLACDSSWQQVYESYTVIWQKRRRKKVCHHYMTSCCQTLTMERKSQLKTIKVSLFFS